MADRAPGVSSPVNSAFTRRVQEERIAALATMQHGVVTRAQLIEIGISSSAIWRRLQAGRLSPLHSGVYLAGPIEPVRAREMAAVLAGGRAAVLSHTSALHLWNLLRSGAPRPVHVTVPASRGPSSAEIVFHRAGFLAHDECTVLDHIPVTTPGRTIVDVAGMLGSRDLELALATAEREGLLGDGELVRLPGRYPRRPGTAMLRSLIGQQTGPHFTESEAERKCLALLRTAGLPRPHTNVTVGPYRLDLFWPEEGVAIEVDSRAYHSSRPRFEGDRHKDNWLRVRGIEVIRLTWRQITRNPTATAVLVAQTLALAQARRHGAASGGNAAALFGSPRPPSSGRAPSNRSPAPPRGSLQRPRSDSAPPHGKPRPPSSGPATASRRPAPPSGSSQPPTNDSAPPHGDPHPPSSGPATRNRGPAPPSGSPAPGHVAVAPPGGAARRTLPHDARTRTRAR